LGRVVLKASTSTHNRQKAIARRLRFAGAALKNNTVHDNFFYCYQNLCICLCFNPFSKKASKQSYITTHLLLLLSIIADLLFIKKRKKWKNPAVNF